MHKNGWYGEKQVWRCAVESRASVTAYRERQRANIRPIELPMPESHARAWAAGFIDGEGCLGGHFRFNQKGRAQRSFRIEIAQKEPQLLHKMRDIFSVGSVVQKGSGYHVWTCSGREAFAVSSAIWPWLGERKKADFKRAMRALLAARAELRWSMRRRPVVYTEAV